MLITTSSHLFDILRGWKIQRLAACFSSPSIRFSLVDYGLFNATSSAQKLLEVRVLYVYIYMCSSIQFSTIIGKQ